MTLWCVGDHALLRVDTLTMEYAEGKVQRVEVGSTALRSHASIRLAVAAKSVICNLQVCRRLRDAAVSAMSEGTPLVLRSGHTTPDFMLAFTEKVRCQTIPLATSCVARERHRGAVADGSRYSARMSTLIILTSRVLSISTGSTQRPRRRGRCDSRSESTLAACQHRPDLGRLGPEQPTLTEVSRCPRSCSAGRRAARNASLTVTK